jgi:hypothetical protein
MGQNDASDKPNNNGENAEARLAKAFNLDDTLRVGLVGAPQAKSRNESYLDLAMDHTLKPAAGLVISNEQTLKTVTDYGKQFVKITPLFMKGNLSVLGLATAYAADEAKVDAPVTDQLIDAGLGAGKGLALKGAFSLMGNRGMSPSMSGIQLGIIQRTSDTALTRSNYYDQDGHFSIATAMTKASKAAMKPEMLAMDAATFGAADVVWGRMYAVTRGAAYYNPVLKNAFVGGTMGAASGAGYETVRQLEEGKFDPIRLAQRATGDGLLGTFSGAVGGMQMRRAMSIDLAKSAPPGIKTTQQEPGFLNAEQMALRDGEFIVAKKATGSNFDGGPTANLTMEAYTGMVAKADGTMTAAIFRPNDGTPAFQARMNAEISGYAANKGGLGDSMPLSVARSVEIGGKTHHGYIQEMGGVDLNSYLNKQAVGKFGSGSMQNMLRVFREDVALQNGIKGALGERMVFGEWDNHSMNIIVRETEAGRVVKNIDMADGLRPTQTKLDNTPTPGFLDGYDKLNSRLYGELAGKPIGSDFKGNLQNFLSRYDNAQGRMLLQEQSGWSHAQIEGVIGRSKWFVEHGIFPNPQQQSMLYPFVGKTYRMLRGRPEPSANLDLKRLSTPGEAGGQ